MSLPAARISRGAPSLGLALAAFVSARAAIPAEPRGPRIDMVTEGCTLDARELDRLVRLELSTVLTPEDTTSRYEVTVACAGDTTRLRITDPLTEKSLERRVVFSLRTAPEPERLVALAVAQVYRSSRLELLTRDAPSLPAGDAIRPPVSVPPQTAHAPQQRLAPAARGRAGALLLRGGVAARRLGVAPFALPGVALEGRISPRPTLWLTLTVGAETATVTRATGQVAVLGVPATLGLGVEPLSAGPFSFFARVDLGVEYASFSGRRVAPGLVAGKVDGLGLLGSVGAGAALRLRAFRVELAPRLGLCTGTPEGRVSGDRAVGMNGAWAGGDLAAGFVF